MSQNKNSDSSRSTKSNTAKTSQYRPSSPAPENPTGTRASSTGSNSTAITNDDDNPFFEKITMAKFEKFQGLIFPIISRIINQEHNKNHPFGTLWSQAVTHETIPLTATTTMRDIKWILPVDNLQYRRFLLECPNLEQFVWFRDSTLTTAGFYVSFRNNKIEKLLAVFPAGITESTTTDLSSYDLLPEQNEDKTEYVTLVDEMESFQICYGNQQDFQALWMQVFLIMNAYAGTLHLQMDQEMASMVDARS